MARITIAALQAQLDEMHAENVRLCEDLTEAHNAYKALKQELAAYQVAERPSRQAPVRQPRQLPAHFAAAREMAMRTGRAVKC